MNGTITSKQAKLILHGTEEEWMEYVLRRRCRMPHLEPYIAKFPGAAHFYARFAIRGRWPEAEPAIAKNGWACEYARFVIKGRWPEAEPYIMQDPWAAARYAAWVIDGRWPEGEPAIWQNPDAWHWYTTCFPKVNI